MEQTSIQTNLVNYTKDYATEQLLRSVRQPMSQYFKFLYAVAEQDAREEKHSGPYKHLVLFQKRVQLIHDYPESKLKRILSAFKKNEDFPLESLLKTILLCNSIIIGSFGQKTVETHTIDIPTATIFIHTLLKNAGQVYFASPESALRLNNKSMEFDVCEDAVLRTIQQLLPFEKLIKPIKEHARFTALSSDLKAQAPQFAENFISQAGEYDDQTVQRIAMEKLQGPQEERQASSFGPEAYRMARDNIDVYDHADSFGVLTDNEESDDSGEESDEYGFVE